MLTVILTPTFKSMARELFTDDEVKAILAALSPHNIHPGRWMGRLSYRHRTVLYARMSPRVVAFLACYSGTRFDDIPEEVMDDWVAQLKG